jgi:argininosuccinate lyase
VGRDIQGSLAHADMLHAQGLISADDLASIQKGMAQIRAEIEAGSFEWKLDLEDVHLNIEARLTQLVGDAGKRLHTGRSRNDQVATDVRLWLRGEIDEIGPLLTRAAARPAGRGRAAHRRDPAGLHAPAGGAAGEPLVTTCWPMWRCSRAMPSA